MKLQLLRRVVLNDDVSDMRLKANDVITVVEFQKGRLTFCYYVEAFNALGETIAVFTGLGELTKMMY